MNEPEQRGPSSSELRARVLAELDRRSEAVRRARAGGGLEALETLNGLEVAAHGLEAGSRADAWPARRPLEPL